MEKATYALITFRPQELPKRVRAYAERVLAARGKVAHTVGDYTRFAFDRLTPTERKRLIADIVALYEACLIDLGRAWPQCKFMYPKDE
jgi:hypothetical protein